MMEAETEITAQIEQGEPPGDGEQAVNQPEGLPEGADDQATSGAEGEEQKPKNRLEQRFSELTSQRDAEKQRAETLEQESRALREQMARLQAQHPMQEHEAQKPNLADFESIESYEQAYGQWVQHGVEVQARAQHQAREQVEAAGKLQATRIRGAQKYQDFDQVVNNPTVPNLAQVAPAAFQTLMASEAAPDIAYALAKDPARVMALQQMPPIAQARAIFALETELTAAPSPSSSTMDPPVTVHGGEGPAVKDPARMSTDEWMAWRNRQLHSS